jgi:hypothetical protein
MKITYMTTYNQVCGIADYSASLIKHIPKEHDITIIAPKLTGEHASVRAVGEEDPRVHRLFNATIWDNIINIEADKVTEIAEKSDIFHMQFQDALFHHDWLYHIVERLKGRTKLVVTLHDTCTGKIWPMLDSFKLILTMKPEVARQVPKAQLVGMPIYYNPPVLKGFGLGRSRHDAIKWMCDQLGYKYEYVKADDKWLPIEELIAWLRDSDGIVLYYDEVPTAGASAAARTALSTNRPLFVNNVTWFNDLPDNVVTRFNDNEDLKQKLKEKYENTYIRENSFEEVAKKHIELYQQILK